MVLFGLMDKKSLSEQDICSKYILPNVLKSGWGLKYQIREQVSFTDGKISKSLFEEINKKSEVLEMKEEDLKALIDVSIAEKISEKDTEIKGLTDKIVQLELKLNEKTTDIVFSLA